VCLILLCINFNIRKLKLNHVYYDYVCVCASTLVNVYLHNIICARMCVVFMCVCVYLWVCVYIIILKFNIILL